MVRSAYGPSFNRNRFISESACANARDPVHRIVVVGATIASALGVIVDQRPAAGGSVCAS